MEGQNNFSGGLNAVAAEDKVAQNEVTYTRNVDFSLVEGAAARRMGAKVVNSVNVLGAINIYKHSASPLYLDRNYYVGAIGSSTVAVATEVFRYNGTSWSSIATGVGIESVPFSYYDNNALFSLAGSAHYRDNGTSVIEWIKQAPTAALGTVTLATVAAVVVATAYTAVEGTASGTGTCTATSDTITYRIQLTATPLSTNLSTNTAGAIGDLGVDYLSIMFDNPEVITKISREYSIGGTTFESYWHTDVDTSSIEAAVASAEELLNSETAVNEFGEPLTPEARAELINNIRETARTAKTMLSAGQDTFNVWAVPRTKFDLVCKDGTNAGWTNIGAVRLVVEASAPVIVTIKDWEIRGGTSYPLNDPDVGYVWWETFATLDTNGFKVAESAPSPATGYYKCVGAKATIISTATATGTIHGFTHRILYRQGGFMKDAYAVATSSYGTATFTDDTPDITALKNNERMERNIYSRATCPGNISDIAEPHLDRIFFFSINQMYWSLPGLPDSFPLDNNVIVSHSGDEVMRGYTWGNGITIVNRDSVYEAVGDVWDGPQANWRLYRTGCTRGSKARRATIKTPYGITLLDYDGLYLYQPGSLREERVDWLMDKVGDMWLGNTQNDPAYRKGLRVPPINKNYLRDSWAMWANNRLYLFMPLDPNCNGAAQHTWCLVVDFINKRCWLYNYPYYFRAGVWDFDDNKLIALEYTPVVGKTHLLRLENSQYDDIVTVDPGPVYTTATDNPAVDFRTRIWTWPATARLTNLNVEFVGTHIIQLNVDGSSTTLSTVTATARDNILPSMFGTQANRFQLKVTGLIGTTNTSPNSIMYGMHWDAYPEPPKELYHRTEYQTMEQEQEWRTADVELDCLSGTCTGTYFVDGTALMTKTMTGTAGPKGYAWAWPARTYGRVAFAEFRATTPFRFYKISYTSTPEPPRVAYWRSPTVWAEGEQEWKTWACDADFLGGSATAVVYIDAVAYSTYTMSGSGMQGYVKALYPQPNPPYNHPFGRSAYVEYTTVGTGLMKIYNTFFDKVAEPPKVLSWRTETEYLDAEHEWRAANVDYDAFGGSIVGVVYVDAVAVTTFTMTGSGMMGYVVAVGNGAGSQPHAYGRSGYITFTSTTPFKIYRHSFERTQEPSRIKYVRTEDKQMPSDVTPKTWVAALNPLGGVVTGVAYLDGTAIQTTTFTGSARESFNVGIDFQDYSPISTIEPNDIGNDLYAIYSSTTPFKHYGTDWEFEQRPFLKDSWQITYTKIGGASELDWAQFFSIDIEGQIGDTIGIVWDADGYVLGTQILTMTATRQFFDRLRAPWGMRGFIYRARLRSNQPCRVWKSSIDSIRIGFKGVMRWFRVEGEAR